jgi:hypothetical protein
MDARVKPAHDAEFGVALAANFLIHRFKQPRRFVPAPPRELGF